jgi:hypothetical protein
MAAAAASLRRSPRQRASQANPCVFVDDHEIPCYPKKSHPWRSPKSIPAIGSQAPVVMVPWHGKAGSWQQWWGIA